MDFQEPKKTVRGYIDIASVSQLVNGCWYRGKFYNKDILNACADLENILIAMCWDVIPNNKQYKSLALPKERYCSKVLTKAIQDRMQNTEIKEKFVFEELSREKGVKIAVQLLRCDPAYFVFIFAARNSKTWEDNFQKIWNTNAETLRKYARDFGIDLFIETGKFNLFRAEEKPIQDNHYEFWV